MVKEINTADFKKEVLDQQVPVLVDFWAPWCGPCRMMAPILEELAGKMTDKIKIAKINTDENQDLAMEYRITGIPCLVLFKGGKEAKRFVGVQPANALETQIKQVI